MNTNPWIPVLVGGLFETVWAYTMKLSHGFTDPLYAALTLIFLFTSTGLLNIGLKLGLPVGTGYAVWVGIGAIGSVVTGILVFGDMLSMVGFFFLALLIVGVIGMNLLTEEEPSGN